MAWKKLWTDPDTGVQADFWEYMSINHSQGAGQSEMKVGVWINEAAHTAKLQPVHVKVYVIPAGAAPTLAAGVLAFGNAYARAQPEFEGSEDA